MANARVTSELGAGISNFSFVLGIVLLVLFIPLWVTSFDSIHKRMGSAKWKKWQKWSYPFYALLFIHAIGIQVGGMISSRETARQTQVIEATANVEKNRGLEDRTNNISTENRKDGHQATENQERVNNIEPVKPVNDSISKPKESRATETRIANSGRGGGHGRSFGFADINVSRDVKRSIHIISLILIFGSYLYLRLRKAKQDAAKRKPKIKA